MNRTDMLAWLKAHLKPKRFEHCLNVEETARELALRYGEDANLAALAGLVHDCAKCFPYESLQRLAPVSDADAFERESPTLLHAPVGAIVARKELGITDVRVLNAIRTHAIGGEFLSTLEQIVFLADLIEPGRGYQGVESVRAAAEEDLCEALKLSISLNLRYVLERMQPVHPTTVHMFNALLNDQRRNHNEQLAGTGAFIVKAVG